MDLQHLQGKVAIEEDFWIFHVNLHISMERQKIINTLLFLIHFTELHKMPAEV